MSPGIVIAPPATAGAYLRRCREEASLTVSETAERISLSAATITFNTVVIQLVERDRHVPSAGFIDRLHTAFPFDRARFHQLGAGPTTRLVQGE